MSITNTNKHKNDFWYTPSVIRDGVLSLLKENETKLLDPCAMRMYPCSNVPYGEEMEQGFRNAEEEDFDGQGEYSNADSMNVFDDKNWY